MHDALDRLATRLTPGVRLTVLTGAGVSAASGVPTFRGDAGLWKSFRAEDLATPQAFARDPRTVWEWYDWRRQRIAGCRPNAAHHVLASWALRFPGFTLITQNVDGLHERAGTPGVVRLHGSIWDVGCARRCGRRPRRWRDETVPFPVLPPPCPECGGPLRPGVVWFGEALDPADLARADAAAACEVFLAVGTSAMVYPAAGLIGAARAHGAFTVEVNPEATAASAAVDLPIARGAEQALPAVDARLGEHPLALTTARLALAPLMPADLPAAHALWTDPAVRRYLWDDQVISEATAEAVLQQSAATFATRRFGLWGLRVAGGRGELAGFCGLREGDAADAPELLFGLMPAVWGQGLAVEAASAVLSHAAARLGLITVLAATDVPNLRSQRTLARLGFRLERRAVHRGLDTLFYRRALCPGGPLGDPFDSTT